MEPRPARVRKTTLVLRTGSPRARSQRGNVIEFKDAPNMDESRIERESKGRMASERKAKHSENGGVNLPPLLAAHLGRNENGQPLQSTLASAYGGHQPSTNSGGNLPPNGTHLSYNAPPFIPNSPQPSTIHIPTYVNMYPQPNASMTYGQPLNYFSHDQGGNPSYRGAPTYFLYGGHVSQAPMSSYGPSPNGSTHPSSVLPNSYPFYTQPINLLPNVPVYLSYDPTGMFGNSTRCVTLFVCWIEEYPLPDGLKMPSHVGSYDGKGDPDNYLHLSKVTFVCRNGQGLWHAKCSPILSSSVIPPEYGGMVKKKRDRESTRAFLTQYTDDTLQILRLHEEQRISGFVHGLKTRSLVEFLSTYLPTTYKGLMEKTYTWIEAKEIATNEAPNDHREGFDRFNKGSSWDNNKGRKKDIDRFSPYNGFNQGLLANLSKIPREILAT
nr:hypothetical protein [Tanacetum cinerariifolium]